MSERYNADDTVTIHFIVSTVYDKSIKAWSFDKAYCKAYMEFHKCPKYRLVSRTDVYDNICKILEQNRQDEIHLCNINTKNPKGKLQSLVVPITDTELNILNGELLEWCSTHIDYTMLYAAKDFLKNKYLKALKILHLDDVCDQVLSHRANAFTEHIALDELLVLFRLFPNDFGK